MKVFCKNCKHFIPWTNSIYGAMADDECGHPSNLATIDTPICQFTKPISNPEYINKDNNCKNYNRSWWRFWIKEK